MGAKIGLIVEKTILPETSDHSPSMAFFEGRLFIAWKGSGNDTLNVAFSQLLNPGVRPVFDLERKHISAETSDNAPALAFHRGALFIAWKGSGNDNLNLMYSDVFPGVSFRTDLKHISQETTQKAPTLASHRRKLFIGWMGTDSLNFNHLNSAEVQFSPDGTRIAGFAPKQVLPGTDSEHGPAMLSYGEQDFFGGAVQSSLFMAWHEGASGALIVEASDSGLDFQPPQFVENETTDRSPALSSNTILGAPAVFSGDLFIAWKGSGNENLNVARVEATVT